MDALRPGTRRRASRKAFPNRVWEREYNIRRRTNLKMHIDNVRDVRDIIKLMKLWKIRHSLQWKTFAMEQTIVRALEGESTGDLGEDIEIVLLYIKSAILNGLSLFDPANSNNPIKISRQQREQIAEVANDSFEALKIDDWESIVW